MTLSFADRGRPSIYTYVSKLKKAQRELCKQKPQSYHQQDKYQQHQLGTSYRKKDYSFTPPTIVKHLGYLTAIQEDQSYFNSPSIQSNLHDEQDCEELDSDDLDCYELDSNDLDSDEEGSSDLTDSTSYLSAWKKLNGLETTTCYKKAISISLSPIFLAAANIARQRRQHTH
jgi:hypothetical protein